MSYVNRVMFQDKVARFERANVMTTYAPVDPAPFSIRIVGPTLMIFVTDVDASDELSIEFIMLRGKHHRVLFTIQEIEAPNAVEAMIEEMADEQMSWNETSKRSPNSARASIFALSTRPPMPPHALLSATNSTSSLPPCASKNTSSFIPVLRALDPP
ncbi:hypothetical protein BC830DRAFT_1141518 [Chytriomyces sp. MP71]|nr:hypothetical protein BC830DRAFT_1141518 [Chytriomyces sp. MP71]